MSNNLFIKRPDGYASIIMPNIIPNPLNGDRPATPEYCNIKMVRRPPSSLKIKKKN